MFRRPCCAWKRAGSVLESLCRVGGCIKKTDAARHPFLGERGNYFAVVGKFRYSESFPINISSSFRPTLTEAFKKALKSGNCTLANELANQLKNGEPKQCGEHLCVGFEDGNGGRCYTRTLVPSLAFFIVSLIISGVKLLSSLT